MLRPAARPCRRAHGAEGKDGLSSARAAGEEGSGAQGNRPQSGRRRRARDHVCRNGARAKSIGHARAGAGDRRPVGRVLMAQRDAGAVVDHTVLVERFKKFYESHRNCGVSSL